MVFMFVECNRVEQRKINLVVANVNLGYFFVTEMGQYLLVVYSF